MFTLFIDQCVDKMSSGQAAQASPFDVRLSALREQAGECLVRTPTYKEASNINTTNEILDNRLQKVELTVTPQKVVKDGDQDQPDGQTDGAVAVTSGETVVTTPGIFPLLDPAKFNIKVKRRGGKRSSASAKLIKGKSNGKHNIRDTTHTTKDIDPALNGNSQICKVAI